MRNRPGARWSRVDGEEKNQAGKENPKAAT
jgi:hypothetical protein